MKRSERNSVQFSTQQHKHIINKSELLVDFDGQIKRVVNKCTFNPLPTKRFTGLDEYNLTGRRFGKMTVIGYSKDNKQSTYHKPNWVCRCECGMYETRKSRAVKNPNNQNDCCHVCRQIIWVKQHKKYLEATQ